MKTIIFKGKALFETKNYQEERISTKNINFILNFSYEKNLL